MVFLMVVGLSESSNYLDREVFVIRSEKFIILGGFGGKRQLRTGITFLMSLPFGLYRLSFNTLRTWMALAARRGLSVVIPSFEARDILTGLGPFLLIFVRFLTRS